MKRISVLLVVFMGFLLPTQAQTLDELKATKAEKEAQVAALNGEISGLAAQISAIDLGWKKGILGTLGLSANSFSNWYQKADANTSATTIGISINSFANLIEEKYFWRNNGNINLGWLKFVNDDDPVTADNGFEQTADVLNISSLYGYKVSDKWAISALGEYRTSVLSNFNNPGYLDIGAGATWTPQQNLVVVFHPLNYNFVFSDSDLSYESSLGCKVVADYTQSLPMGLAWKSNLSAFFSYKDISNLSNYTWVNSFSASIFNGVGLGFEFGLRGNKQESFNAVLADPDVVNPPADIDALDSGDNKVQTYWLFGVTYSIAK